MNLLKPFRGLRPRQELAEAVASHPYDVIDRAEASELAKDNSVSFLHINKPEIDCPAEMDSHDEAVYAKGAENLGKFREEGILQQDDKDSYYLYQQTMGSHSQLGLVAVASIDAYDNNIIKKHEFTRPEKEDDRVYHMDALGAQVGPVFLTYEAIPEASKYFYEVAQGSPEYDFVAPDGTRHVFWVLSEEQQIEEIDRIFAAVPCLYIADGHHRSAAASRVRKLHQERNDVHTGEEPYNSFLVVVFPHDQMKILDYNRLISDLNGLSPSQFLAALEVNFEVQAVSSASAAKPISKAYFGVYLERHWYRLQLRSGLVCEQAEDPSQSLDVSLMQKHILSPILGIHDQRSDRRVDFVGGIRGLQELEVRVDEGGWAAAIALFPTTVTSLMEVADANQVMPPKSTWFEPKLKSGLVTHLIR